LARIHVIAAFIWSLGANPIMVLDEEDARRAGLLDKEKNAEEES
jgi:hypothetical protein